jgi:hypothetical protein
VCVWWCKFDRELRAFWVDKSRVQRFAAEHNVNHWREAVLVFTSKPKRISCNWLPCRECYNGPDTWFPKKKAKPRHQILAEMAHGAHRLCNGIRSVGSEQSLDRLYSLLAHKNTNLQKQFKRHFQRSHTASQAQSLPKMATLCSLGFPLMWWWYYTRINQSTQRPTTSPITS